MEHQTEPSVKLDLLVRIWGMAEGRPFFQNVHTQEINKGGAKISGIEHRLSVGDVIGVQLGDKKARVKVMWVIDAGQTQKSDAGVEMLEGQPCPWQQGWPNLEKPAPLRQPAPQAKKMRRFGGHRIPFPTKILERRAGALMRT